MQLQTFVCMFAAKIFSSLAKEDELPLCPTDVNYLPQSLPMHCRMPRHADYPMFPGLPPNFTFPPLPPSFQSFAPDKQPPQMPVPIPGAQPRAAPMPMPMHVPMMPMPAPAAAAHKLPVIVMPFYSPDGTRKPADTGRHTQRKKKKRINRKRKHRHHSDTDTDTDSGTDTSDIDDWSDHSHESSAADSDVGWWEGRRSGKRPKGKSARKLRKHRNKKALLQPILQYVTKDGYVIYEKKISKNQANDWLQNKKEENTRDYNEPPKDEDKDKEEENDVMQDVDTATDEPRGRKGAGTKIVDDENKTKMKSYKNPHRRKSKKASKDKDEHR